MQFAPQGQFSNYHRALYGEIVVIVLKKNRRIFAVPDVTSLLHSPYVLTHLFVQINLESHFLVKENFTCSMIEFLSDSKFRALPFRINIRIFFLDIVNLLQFAKSASVFNLNLNLSNVSMHIFNETSCRYKIMDISLAQSIRHSNACLADIADFGETLQQVQTEFVKPYQSRNFDKNVWRVDDHLLLENIKRRMILDKHSTKVTMPFTNILNSQKSAHFNQLPTIEEVSRHAFTWNSGEKINCLLRAVKILESQERDIFAMLLEQKSVQTMKKWTNFIDKDVLDALNEILQKTTKSQVMYEKDGVCSLVKKVRNLVKISLHYFLIY